MFGGVNECGITHPHELVAVGSFLGDLRVHEVTGITVGEE